MSSVNNRADDNNTQIVSQQNTYINIDFLENDKSNVE